MTYTHLALIHRSSAPVRNAAGRRQDRGAGIPAPGAQPTRYEFDIGSTIDDPHVCTHCALEDNPHGLP
jgi:hypothetical protein